MTNTETASRIDWIGSSCRLLAATAKEFSETKPFAGMTIGTAIHLEPKTAALLMTLNAGGARVVATGNLNSTQPETVSYLSAHGIEVIGEQTTDAGAHDRFIAAILAEEPELLLDNGGDLSPGLPRSPTRSCAAGRRRRPPAGCGSCRCATG